MDKVSILRKLIREEVAKAIRQEFPKILKEHMASQSGADYKSTIQTNMKSKLSDSINNQRKQIAESMRQDRFSKSNPFGAFLNDTAHSMDTNEFLGTGEGKEPRVVESVDKMLASVRGGGSVETMGEIDVVPDFTNMMGSLKEKGLL